MSRRLRTVIVRVVQEAELRESLGRLGRIDFALRILTITGIAFAFEFLGDALLHLTQLPHLLYVVQRIILFGAFGTILLRGIDQRLLDVGLARWYRYPVIAAWLLSVSLPTAWPFGRHIGLGLFLLLLILGCSIHSKPLPTEFDSTSRPTAPEWNANAPRKRYQPNWFNTPVSFLRNLLTLACFWLPLIWLQESGGEMGIWFARFGYCILSLVWLSVVIGRLNDAGRLPRKRYGFLLTGLVLLIGVLRHAVALGWLAQSTGPVLSSGAFVATFVEALLRHVNGYEILTLFLLIQLPLAFLKSEPEPRSEEYERWTARRQGRAQQAKVNVYALCGPTKYLRILALIDCLWVPLIYMDRASGGFVGTWTARVGYLVLVSFWMTFAHGRLVDAGMAHREYPAQYFLVTAVASLMPLGFRWVNGYGSLAIFALLQIPVAFLRTKPLPCGSPNLHPGAKQGAGVGS